MPGQGAVCQPGGAPVRARARRRPDAGAGQRARRPHRQGRRAELREVGAGRRRRAAGGRRRRGGGGLNLLPWPKVDFAKFGEIETKPLSRIQKISGANLARNWAMIPHVTQHDDADITELEALRVALNKENEKAGIKLTHARVPDEGRRSRRCRSSRTSTPRSMQRREPGAEEVLPHRLRRRHAQRPGRAGGARRATRRACCRLAQETARARGEGARQASSARPTCRAAASRSARSAASAAPAFTPIINAPEVAILGVSKSAMQAGVGRQAIRSRA